METFENNKTSIWEKYLIILILLSFCAYYFIFIHSSIVNVIWQAWFVHLPLVEKFHQGILGFKDLWFPFGEHGLFGYNVLFLVNVIFFHLNAFFDAYINLSLILLSSIAIYLRYRKSLFHFNALLFIPISFILIVFVMFNVSQGIGGGMDIQVRMSIACFLITIALLDQIMFEEKASKIKYTILGVMILMSILIFGTAYSFAWIPAVFIFYLLKFVTAKKIDKSFFVNTLLLMISLFLYYIIYLKGHISVQNDPAVNGISNKIISIISQPLHVIKFILASLSNGIISRTIHEYVHTSSAVLLLNGFFLMLIYLYSLKLYISSKMWTKTFLPIALIMYTFGIIILVLIGRPWDWVGGTDRWYTVHYKFGIVGIIWILIYSIQQKAQLLRGSGNAGSENIMKRVLGNKPILIMSAIIFYIVSALIYSEIYDWKRAPYVKKYFAVMVPYAFVSADEMPVDERGVTPFITDLNTTINGLKIMEKYNLNVYYEAGKKIGNTLQTAMLMDGWYQDKWVGKNAKAIFKSGGEGKLVLDGYLPGNFEPNEVEIFIDGKLSVTKVIKPGESFRVELDVERNSLINLKIQSNYAVVPKEKGWSEDDRPLSLMISSIYLK
ncbi:MAG: hypothetical protein WC980_02315 [Candidatus Brocadiia bacterium]